MFCQHSGADFARAIQEMASCMLDIFGKTSDGETGISSSSNVVVMFFAQCITYI